MIDAPAVHPFHTEFQPSVWAMPLKTGWFLKRLAVEVLARAVEDAMGHDVPTLIRETAVPKAREWLLSENCELYCHIAGVDFEKMRNWVHAGCSKPDPALLVNPEKQQKGGKKRKNNN